MSSRKPTSATRKAASGEHADGNGSRYDKRRAEVIDVAAALFARQGYHATSIDDLVQATGLQRGGLYHYMDGKKDLLVQIHQRFIEPLLQEALEIVEEGGPADQVLRNLARALMRDIATYRDQVTVFLHEWRLMEGDPEWEKIRQSRREFEGLVESVLDRGAKEEVFAIGDRRLTLLAFLGAFNYSHEWFHDEGRITADQVAEAFSDILLSGILAEKT